LLLGFNPGDRFKTRADARRVHRALLRRKLVLVRNGRARLSAAGLREIDRIRAQRTNQSNNLVPGNAVARAGKRRVRRH
jgi:hypothetical protein